MDTDQHAVVPMIAYEDGPAAMDWLARAFGFRERTRMIDRSGRLAHGEIDAGGGLIMLATPRHTTRAPGTTARSATAPSNGPRSRG